MATTGLINTAITNPNTTLQPATIDVPTANAIPSTINATSTGTVSPKIIGSQTTGATAQAPTNTVTDTVATPANVSSVPTPAATTPREITAKETVAGQLNDLLSQDSRYIQSARNAGMQTANARGLINSSLAAGTAEKAAIDAAAPIATSDANTYATAGLSAQNNTQDKGLAGYQSQLASAQAKENFGYTTAENAQNIKGNMDIQKQAQDANLVIQNLNISQQEKASLTSATGPIIQQVQAEISQIQRTPDSVLSPEAKTAAIAYQQQALQAQLQTISSLYGYKVDWSTPTATTPAPSNT